ncbi:MAG: type II CRISPR RNA-guided endonuclease Cas9, partial [Planctomycetes bacterium]|nr:type II CRISPR RNA-guided endonuclease Cas9 [Planctomycetota bacterium]
GNRTDSIIASKKCYGDGWHDLEESTKNSIVSSLLNPNIDELEFVKKAKTEWSLVDSQISALLSAPLPDGYGSLSLKAIEKLLPFLEQGMIYSASNPEDSALHAAGYLRRDQLQRRLFDFLPDPQRRKNTPIGNIPNPVVKRTLSEVRKLVNAIIREYGKPDEIHVEMARDLQMGKLKRDEYSKTIRERERTKEQIAVKLVENNQRPTRENILRYQLWVEQKYECLYTGRPISQSQLWGEGGGVEVDHILPRSRTLDDSQSNKVLCFRDVNGEKNDRTPYEWLGSSHPIRFDEIATRAMHLVKDGKMAFAKYRRIIQKELLNDDFVARQLVDTAYITKATAEYLRCLFDAGHHVLGLKGRLTAELRWQWGLESILEELPDSPAWIEKSTLRPGEKNRADHRHHAIDAIVIALTSRARLQELANYLKPRSNRGGELLDTPWDGFRDDVKKRIKSVWVSHKVERKVSGALHEETQYGATQHENEWV